MIDHSENIALECKSVNLLNFGLCPSLGENPKTPRIRRPTKIGKRRSTCHERLMSLNCGFSLIYCHPFSFEKR